MIGYFSYFTSQFKRIATFLHILAFLLIFNLYFNLNYDWFGVSLIVRVYLFVLAFYYIYNLAMDDIHSVRADYEREFGKKGEIILLFESRILPFAFIYLITVVFTLVDYIRIEGWPWNALTTLFNGRYSNLIIYSLILLFVLKIKKSPFLTIPVFFAASILYFGIDTLFYRYHYAGVPVTLFKVIKFLLVFFFIFWDFIDTKKSKLFASILVGVFSFGLYIMITAFYFAAYTLSGEKSYVKRESGLLLARFGYPVALANLQKHALYSKDPNLLDSVERYNQFYGRKLQYSDAEWGSLLFSGSPDRADRFALYMNQYGKVADKEQIIAYFEREAPKKGKSILGEENLIHLAGRSLSGNEDILVEKMNDSGKLFRRLGIRILGESGSYKSLPLLVSYLTNIDSELADDSYLSIVKITGSDPVKERNLELNSPETIRIFKEIYLQKGIASE